MENQNSRPRIGLLGLMTDGYEATFPGILERQKKYAQSLAGMYSDEVEIVFNEIGANRESIEKITADYNVRGIDGILIVLLESYPGTIYFG